MADNIKPTAGEQLPPLGIVFTEEMRESQTARYAAILEERERQLLAALRSNREKDAQIAEMRDREVELFGKLDEKDVQLAEKDKIITQRNNELHDRWEQLSKSLTFDRITYLLNEWGQYQARNMFLELEASLKKQEKP